MRDARKIFNDWLEYINNSDVESLLNLYDFKAILIPTFSNSILNTPDKLREYFENLGARDDLSITVDEETLIIEDFENHISSLSGIYNWHFKINGMLRKFEARFSYLFDLSREKPILHHHSSKVPEKL
ncbi:MAG: hypothetical protein CFH01_00870 [Alphaproteobacteria bacterium MarineAlpha2_Bin1]|nr:MAG: hypothetical protein CFH01_00870 [Alphaproteobacteria bacterium MarineAlpha2_Bin1]